MFIRILSACAIVTVAATAHGTVLTDLKAAPAFFNPSLKQTATLSFSLSAPATLSARVVDRDGVPVRSLASKASYTAGAHKLTWDGRVEDGTIVPNEAWSFRLDVTSAGVSETYFPAEQTAPMYEVSGVVYDRSGGRLRYVLPKPSRVHLQAGTATVDPESKKVTGPVLRTIVNREPRPSGAVIEYWNGYDESGGIAVAELPNFVTAVAATPLPENSVITVGSRGKAFIDTLASRKVSSLLPRRAGLHAHHEGLTSAEDVTPQMTMALSPATNQNGRWQADGRRAIVVRGEVSGSTTTDFVRQHGEVLLFVDGKLVRTQPGRKAIFEVPLAVKDLLPGDHVIAINWVSPHGPTAVAAAKLVIGPDSIRAAVGSEK